MIRVGLLLAAGSSRRFGAEDKLLAPLHDHPLITYAAEAMQGTELDRKIAVISNPAVRPYLDGFEIVEIEPSEQSDSIRAGVIAAGDCDRLLIALADMPGITSDLLKRIFDATTEDYPSASSDNGPPMPPACFPTKWLPRLLELNGDRGAGSLLRKLPEMAQIQAPGMLQDIDTIDQLRQAERSVDDNSDGPEFSCR